MVAKTDTVIIESPVAKRILADMVAIGEEITGGPLPQLHERPVSTETLALYKEELAPLAQTLLISIADDDTYIQAVPNLRVHRPSDQNSVVPFHSDVLYGHSLDEVNYWVTLTPVFSSNSLWLVGHEKTESLHRALREQRLSLKDFEDLARAESSPIESASPGVHSFCCGQIHGAVLNETGSTRMSLDLRMLGGGKNDRVKRRGTYFRPAWLPEVECPLPAGTPVTTVATLDESIPLYLQRMAMERFYPQREHAELVEFYNLPSHSPTLADAMSRGPVLAYTVRQLREVPELSFPIGFVDEQLWIRPDQVKLLERLLKETRQVG
jgi:hypothetical protein